jgi:hypothetical protein
MHVDLDDAWSVPIGVVREQRGPGIRAVRCEIFDPPLALGTDNTLIGTWLRQSGSRFVSPTQFRSRPCLLVRHGPTGPLEGIRTSRTRRISPKFIQRKITIPISVEMIETRWWALPFFATDPTVSVNISIFHYHFGTTLRMRRRNERDTKREDRDASQRVIAQESQRTL